MEALFYELSVLSRSIAFRNLSTASRHVGLSQPQLSRIIRRIEEAYGVVLLDRTTKRFASWTPVAFQLTEFYSRKLRAFESEIGDILKISQTKQLVLGTLEGLIPMALPVVHFLLEKADVKLVELDVYDLDRLESLFTKGELDLIFTSREPGRRKFQNVQTLGFQSLDIVESNNHFKVLSTFEHSSKGKKSEPGDRVLISNSLQIRREWFQRYGGVGTLPSIPTRKAKLKKETEPVLMVGAETLSKNIWDGVVKAALGSSTSAP